MHYRQFTDDDARQVMVGAEEDGNEYRALAAQLAQALKVTVDWFDGYDIPIGVKATKPFTFNEFHAHRRNVYSQLVAALDAASKAGLL